jgi:hypothetical protein
MRSNETLNNRSTELNPHANFTNSTHARLRQQLNATRLNDTQLNSTALATALPYTGTFTTGSGSVVQVSSANANEVCRTTHTLISHPEFNVTVGGECKEQGNTLYYNGQCDTGMDYRNPDWLTRMMLTSCDLNNTALPANMVDVLNHFCNDGPDAINNLNKDIGDFNGMINLMLMTSIFLCCCAGLCGMMSRRDREEELYVHQDYSLLHNPNHEAFEAAEDEHRELISNQMNGVSSGPRS